MEEICIRGWGLRKEYDELIALQGVDITVPCGEVFGLVGPNGAGKTTLLNILATADRPDYGRASVLGHDLDREPLTVRRLVGFMPDFYSLYEPMTVEDFLCYFGLAFGVAPEVLDRRVPELLEEVNLAGKRRALVGELSRGMRQRLVFAKTLVHDPEALILDEPLSGLDPLARMEMMEVLKKIAARRKTVIVSSHILSELSDFCTMVGIMEKGRLVVQGRIAEVLAGLEGAVAAKVEVLGDAARAREIAAAVEGVTVAAGEGAEIRLRLDRRERLAAINRALVEAGVEVLALYEEKSGLEDIYFKLARHEVS